MALSKKQIKYLIGLCHPLSPVVSIGQKGLTDAVRAELELALDHHELIKVKLRGERDERTQWVDQIAADTGAETVQKIGLTACFYRENPEKRQIDLPRA